MLKTFVSLLFLSQPSHQQGTCGNLAAIKADFKMDVTYVPES